MLNETQSENVANKQQTEDVQNFHDQTEGEYVTTTSALSDSLRLKDEQVKQFTTLLAEEEKVRAVPLRRYNKNSLRILQKNEELNFVVQSLMNEKKMYDELVRLLEEQVIKRDERLLSIGVNESRGTPEESQALEDARAIIDDKVRVGNLLREKLKMKEDEYSDHLSKINLELSRTKERNEELTKKISELRGNFIGVNSHVSTFYRI